MKIFTCGTCSRLLRLPQWLVTQRGKVKQSRCFVKTASVIKYVPFWKMKLNKHVFCLDMIMGITSFAQGLSKLFRSFCAGHCFGNYFWLIVFTADSAKLSFLSAEMKQNTLIIAWYAFFPTVSWYVNFRCGGNILLLRGHWSFLTVTHKQPSYRT